MKSTLRTLALIFALTALLSLSSCKWLFGNKTDGDQNKTDPGITDGEGEKDNDTEGGTVDGEGGEDGEKGEEHTSCEWNIETIVQDKSCTDDGVVVYACACGEKKTVVDKAEGHNYSEWVSASEPTCTVAGKRERICSACSEKETAFVEKLAHNYEITEEEKNGIIYDNYMCSLCSDSFSVSKEITQGFENADEEHISNCEPYFSFDIVSAGDEEYIRDNLVIVDSYFEDSEDEKNDFAIAEYDLENVDTNVWRVTPANAYEAGNTYKAKRSGDVVFKEYGVYDFTFSILKEETSIMEFKDGIIFVQTLENRAPGYYPYTIEYSDNSGLYWVDLGKTDGLEIGDIICIGEAESMSEVFETHSGNNTFGKIELITYSQSEKIYRIAMSVPSFSEIFSEVDIYTSKLEQASDVEFVDEAELESQVVAALYNSEDFIKFMGASYVTATEFLDDRGAVITVGTFSDFLNSIRIDEQKTERLKLDPETDTITAKITIVGKVAIPVTVYSSGENRNVGNIVISFSAYVNLDYLKLVLNFEEHEVANADEKKLTKLKIGAEQSVTTGFTFNVEISVDYSMEATPYVFNMSSRVYHFESCKHVAAMKESNIMRISAEALLEMVKDGSVNADNECGTCRPISSMKSDNYVLNKKSKVIHLYDCKHLSTVSSSELLVSGAAYGNLELSGYKACESCKPYSRYTNSFSESLLSKMQSNDFGFSMEEIKKIAETAGGAEQSKKIPVAEVPVVIGPCKVDFELYVFINFTIKASISYQYEQTAFNEYGFVLGSAGFRSYRGERTSQNKNLLTATGSTRLDVGALGVIRASFVGFEKCMYASFNAQCGMYATASGALYRDFKNHTGNYMVAYFECGLNCNIYGEIKIPFFKIFTFPFYEGEYPALKLGYERVIFEYVGVPESLTIDSVEFFLGRNDLMMVKYYDLLTMKNGTAKLSCVGLPGRYTVTFTLKYGDNCYVKDGYLYVIDPSESFTDEITVAVKAYDVWDDFKPNNTKMDLPTYKVAIEYEGTGENTGGEEITYSQGIEFTSNGDGTCYVSGIGTCTDTDIVIPSISPNGDRVTSIGDSAFYDCRSLLSVEIADSVTSIGEQAFRYCSALTSIEIPDSVTSIGDSAFSWSDSLTNVVIGKGVTSIGTFAFGRCNLLTNITVSEKNTKYKSIDGNLYTKDGKILIQYSIGKPNDKLVIPDSVISISEQAFYNCISLTSIVIPEGVTSIGSRAFESCTSLRSIAIPDGITIINDGTFYGCDSLKSIEIPDSVTSIGWGAFIGCKSLASIEIPANVTNIGGSAFQNCSNLTSVVIPDGVTSIETGLFSGCSSLTNIKISDSVTSIGYSAFAGCTKLTSIEIPDGVTSIGWCAFYECTRLTSVKIPKSVTNIMNLAFHNNVELFYEGYIDDSLLTLGGEYKLYYYSEVKPSEDGDFWRYVDGVPTPWVTYSKGLEYTLVDNSYYMVSGIGTCTDTDIFIPETYNGKPVYAIDDYAFDCVTKDYDVKIKSVTLGNNILVIGTSAFHACTALESVVIPSSVSAIFDFAFYECSSLKEVIMYKGVEEINDWAFFGCNSLTDVYYSGTETEWNQISIVNSYNLANAPLLNATRHYNYVPVEESDKICLSSFTPTFSDRYTGNMGDSHIFILGGDEVRNGNIGVDGNEYHNGLEVWIARWNYTSEISWVKNTYDIGGKYGSLTGKIGLIQSYNVKNFDTTIYIYGDGELLFSQVVTDENYNFEFSVDVTDVSELTVYVKDNNSVSGGTSFALYDLFLH